MEVQSNNSCMYVERNSSLPGGLWRFPDGSSVDAKGSGTTTMMPFMSKLDCNALTQTDNGSGAGRSNASGSCVTSAGLPGSSNNLLLPPSSSSSSLSPHFLMPPLPPSHDDRNCYGMDDSNGSLKAKIMAHPHYPRLLTAYANCHKVGAPREVVVHLEDAAAQATARGCGGNLSSIGDDPALDQFMEAYCEMLTKYEQELTKPFKEAMIFINKIESQFKSLAVSSCQSGLTEGVGRNSSEDEGDDGDNDQIDPQAKERELKDQLLKRYSGYLGSLKQEFLKKRKKGKLPKEARQQLLDWWARHYKWPYPSESQKLALAESTGLDQKQINNWFINQRKRHWRPSEEMQLVVMDASHPHYYMDDIAAHAFSVDCSPMLL